MLDSPAITDTVTPHSVNVLELAGSPNGETSSPSSSPVADDHVVDTQPPSQHSLLFKDTQSQQPVPLEQDTPNLTDSQLRKSARTVKKPVWMEDYVCNGSLIESVSK